MLSEPRGRTRFLSDSELAELLKVAREHSTLMHTAITLSIACGMRRGELLRIDWQDVDLTKQTLRIHVTKNDQPRTVHVSQSACDELRALQGSRVAQSRAPCSRCATAARA